jgi:uncharacterized protein YbjQ (UPF0145 family)/predicted DNA-binding transcriptional regulator AlpA
VDSTSRALARGAAGGAVVIAVTTASRIRGYYIAAYKGIAQGETFEELSKSAEALGANAIFNTCFDDALDVDTLFHGAAVLIEAIPTEVSRIGDAVAAVSASPSLSGETTWTLFVDCVSPEETPSIYIQSMLSWWRFIVHSMNISRDKTLDERPILTAANSSRLLTPEDVAEVTGLSTETLAQWRSQRRGIPFLKISRNRVRYRQRDLDIWLADRLVRTDDDNRR